jgi:hypothetical protein
VRAKQILAGLLVVLLLGVCNDVKALGAAAARLSGVSWEFLQDCTLSAVWLGIDAGRELAVDGGSSEAYLLGCLGG